jgi:hypothetical protein
MGLVLRNRLDLPVDGLFVADFAGTANPLSDGGIWIQGATDGIDWADAQLSSGLACGTQPGTTGPPYDDAVALLRGLWQPNQKARATVKSINQTSTGFCEVELRLRSTIRPRWNSGYEINWRCTKDGSQYSEVIRWNGPVGIVSGGGGAYTALEHKVAADGIPGITDGDIVEAWIVGDLISVYQNGSLLYTHDTSLDTANSYGLSKYASGSPGIAFWRRNNGATISNTDFGFTAFRAWDSRYSNF